MWFKDLTGFNEENPDQVRANLTMKEDRLVSQIYCSALPVAYCDAEPELWGDFASLVLEAAYEATFYAAERSVMMKSGYLAR